MMDNFAVVAEEFLSKSCKIADVPHRSDLEPSPDYSLLPTQVKEKLSRPKPALCKRALASVELLKHVWAFRDELSRRGFGPISSILAVQIGSFYSIMFAGQKTTSVKPNDRIEVMRSAWAEAKQDLVNANRRPVRKKIAELAEKKLAQVDIKVSINTLIRDSRLN